MEAASSPITQITNYQPRQCHTPEDFLKLLCQTMHMVHSKGSANYGQSCAALLEFFPDTINCGNYGPVQKIKSCDLYFNFNPLAPGLNFSISRITVCQYCAYHNINPQV